jgi:hypothetical protein
MTRKAGQEFDLRNGKAGVWDFAAPIHFFCEVFRVVHVFRGPSIQLFVFNDA